jgi:hypothetical protein
MRRNESLVPRPDLVHRAGVLEFQRERPSRLLRTLPLRRFGRFRFRSRDALARVPGHESDPLRGVAFVERDRALGRGVDFRGQLERASVVRHAQPVRLEDRRQNRAGPRQPTIRRAHANDPVLRDLRPRQSFRHHRFDRLAVDLNLVCHCSTLTFRFA